MGERTIRSSSNGRAPQALQEILVGEHAVHQQLGSLERRSDLQHGILVFV